MEVNSTVKECDFGPVLAILNCEFGKFFHPYFVWKSFLKNGVRYIHYLTLTPLIFLIFAHI